LMTPMARYNSKKKVGFATDSAGGLEESQTPHPNQQNQPMVLPGQDLSDPHVQETLVLLQQLLKGLNNVKSGGGDDGGEGGSTESTAAGTGVSLQDLLAGLRGGNNSRDVLKKKKTKKSKIGDVRPMFSRKKKEEEEAAKKAKAEEEKKKEAKEKEREKTCCGAIDPIPTQLLLDL